ncbi:virulence protein [Devosia riboflavina]|uniref:Virulence protein n=1 Tax=Devosia riboflavina TaxID=46914 RepID=A0A087M4D6_9HYPH|nr:DUF4815 domain-containing protein [Devosia riboflavina]KFL31739.1 virulence protein [Devosia riboflavina]
MFEHPSGLPYAYARHRGQRDVQGLVFHGKRPYLETTEFNDLQDVMRNRMERMGRLIAEDGDRYRGAAIIVDRDAGTVTLTEGEIYVAGDLMPVGAAFIEDVAMIGSVSVGVRMHRTYVTAEDDPSLLGLVAGADSEGEEGAAREIAHITWALADDGGEGEFYQVYLLQDGTALDQTPPPLLEGYLQALQLYDRPHGHYIVKGCRVSNLGVNAGQRTFSIEEGEANIWGRKVTRHASLRHNQPEVWDIGAVPGETHAYAGGGSHTLTLALFPLNAVTSILLTKERTVNVTRGALTNGIDALPDDSVISISSVTQGGTTYTSPADYKRTGNGVDWAAAGAEPAIGSLYSVTYRYRASVVADATTPTTITVSGGVAGGDIIVAYTYKLPRIDVLGLLPSGASTYVKGISARANPVRPLVPADVLPLCEIRNDWFNEPIIVTDKINTGVIAPTWSEFWRYVGRIDDHDRLIQQNRRKLEIDQRDPAAKRGIFVDPFTDSSFRDAGIPQNGAVGNGILQLAIEPTFYDLALPGPITLDWVEEVIIDQPLVTGCVLINPYQNFTPLPGILTLSPAVDFWTVSSTVWADDQTLEFLRGVQNWGGPLTETTVRVDRASRDEAALPFLRERSVDFVVAGFYPTEELVSLTFDGVDILPAGLDPADEDGTVRGAFTIPAGITAGSKEVIAEGSVTRAEGVFTGQGTLVVDVMRRTTTINTWTMPASTGGSETGAQGVRSGDPQAQIFVPPAVRQLVGVDFRLCAIGAEGNAILIHQTTVENGFPTNQVEAEALVSMVGAVVGWKSARYSVPVTTYPDRDTAFVVKTDDGDHSVSIAALGGFDAERQQAVTAHPYPIGPRLDSVNARTWTAHQKEAQTFRVVAAYYPVTTKVVELDDVDLVACSDLQIRAVAELPSSACSVLFEVERANGTVYRLQPYQVLQLPEYLTETVSVRALLTGTHTLSPVLFGQVQVVAGSIESEALYVTTAFPIEDAIRVTTAVKAALPSGSAKTLRYQVDGGAWSTSAVTATELSPDPTWVEHEHKIEGISGDLMRIEIKLTGGPAARPRAADFGIGII